MGRSPTLSSPLPGPGSLTTINIIIDRSVGGVDKLHIGLVNPPRDPEREAMTLHIGGRTFKFVDALHESAGDYHTYSWHITPRFGWANTDTVAVSITALPIVFVEPPGSGTDVEYGEVAEFIFTRTGSTDEALSFTFLHTKAERPLRARSKLGNRASGTSTGPLTWTKTTTRSASSRGRCSLETVTSLAKASQATGALCSSKGPGTTCMGGI